MFKILIIRLGFPLLTLFASIRAGVAQSPPAAVSPTVASPTATLLIEAYQTDGTALGLTDFINITNYVASARWPMGVDYGIFPMGTPPAVAQIGSPPSSVIQGQVRYVSFTVPANQAFYFTCLWKAPNIGTVFMRADNQGNGYTLAPNETRVLQVPYEFALSEYAVASQIGRGGPLAISVTSANALQQAANLLQAAQIASTDSERAIASYQALGVIMPLKERMTVEISNSNISRTGYRKDFVLNYEGFGSWAYPAFVPYYSQAKAAGFSFLLTTPDWNQISPTQGVYEFSSMDSLVDQATALGYQVSISGINLPIESMPPWVANLSFDDLKALYYQNAFMFVQHFKGKITSIYPQAEPELAVHGHTVAEVGELTRQSLNGARAAAPDMQFGVYLSAAAYVGYQMNPVSNPDYVSGWDVLNYLVQNNIKADFIGLEMQYSTVFAPVDLQRQQEVLQAYHNLAQVPIYIGETGYSSKTEDYGIQNPFYWHDGLTEQAQSEWADGLLRISYGTPFMKGLNWVHLDPDDVDASNGSNILTPFNTAIAGSALFRNDGGKKKVYSTFQDFTSRIASFTPGVPGTAVFVEATGGMNQSAAVDTLFGSALQATVHDFLGNGVPNVTVTFTAPSSGAGGLFPGSATSAVAITNNAGVAIAPLFWANASTGVFQSIASVAGVSMPAIFPLTNTQSVPIPNNCTFELSAAGQGFSAQGGTDAVSVVTGSGCAWSISNLPAWMTLTSAASGVGSGAISFLVPANTGGDRSASFTIGGQNFTIEQVAASIPGISGAGSLAQVTSEGSWDFTLNAINLGTSAAEARFNFSDNDGSALPLPLTFPQQPSTTGPLLASTLDRILNPNAQMILDSTGPASATALVGWGELLTNGKITGFGTFSNPTYGWNAAVPLETRNASSYVLAFDNTGSLSTGLAIANIAAQSANVPVILRDDSGAQIGTATLTLAAQGHMSFMLNQQYPVTAGKRGTVEFDTPPGGQISVLGLRANGPALTTLPVLANVGANGGSIAHVAYNGGFTSTFYLVNTGAAAAQFTLSFFDESGTSLSVPLSLPETGATTTTSALTQTLAAGGMLVVETQAQDALASVSGSAQLTTTDNVSGFEIFRWTTFGQEASVPMETRTPNSFFLVFDDTNGLTTGVAVANVANVPANITVNLRDDTGALLQTATLSLAARGHTSFMLPTAYPGAANLRGMAEFVVPTGGQISVIGLRAKSDGTLTTIPVLTK